MDKPLSKITTGKVAKPPRIVLYSVEGLGKSTFGASALKPIVIPTEDGLDELDVPKFPKAESFEEVMENLRALYDNEHNYKTVIIDTADWMEPLIWASVCEIHGKANIEDFGYGKGFTFALDEWERLFKGLDRLRNERGLAVIIIAHAEVKRFDSPDTEPYDRYQIKLHRHASALLVEWCDALIFANYQIFTEKTDVGFNKKVVRGTGGHDRIMYTEERPAFKAKNRYGLPPELPFEKGKAWNELVGHIKASRQPETKKGEQ